MERHPIDYGLFLLIERPDFLATIAPGYYAWAYAFSRLLRKTLREGSASYRDDVLKKIEDYLKPPDHGTEERTLTPAFSHMRMFDYLTRCRRNFSVCAGVDLGIKSDIGFRYGSQTIGMDVKCLLQGWSNTTWDGLLTDSLSNSPSATHFRDSGDGYVLMTLPSLAFFGKTGTQQREDALVKFEQDLSDALAGRRVPDSYFENVTSNSQKSFAPSEMNSIVAAHLKPNFSKRLIYSSRLLGDGIARERTHFACIYIKNEYEIFDTNVLRCATKAIKQAGADNRAILAADFNFLIGFKAATTKQLDKFRETVNASMVAICNLLQSRPETRSIRTVMHCHDFSVLSPRALMSLQPLTRIELLTNEVSGFPRVLSRSLRPDQIYDW